MDDYIYLSDIMHLSNTFNADITELLRRANFCLYVYVHLQYRKCMHGTIIGDLN